MFSYTQTRWLTLGRCDQLTGGVCIAARVGAVASRYSSTYSVDVYVVTQSSRVLRSLTGPGWF